jgi:hypothetical protein
MRQSLGEGLKMPEGRKVAQPKPMKAFLFEGTGSEYLLFWQCAIVEIRCIGNMPLLKVPMTKLYVIDIVPNQINVPMLYFIHLAICKSINRSAIARMKVPLATFSDLTNCQSFCCK